MAETSRLAGTKRGRGDEEIGADSNSNADSDPRQALGLGFTLLLHSPLLYFGFDSLYVGVILILCLILDIKLHVVSFD